jgi:hypothetical protein
MNQRSNVVGFLFFLVMIMLTITATACTPANDYSLDYHYETDFQYPYVMQGEPLSMATNGDGYYFMRGVLGGGVLYYVNKEEMKPVLLDPRPDSTCLQDGHENRKKDCSAYFELGIHTGFLTYYDGKLYTLELKKVTTPDKPIADVARLIEIASDGTSRKTRFTFPLPPMALAMHRGVLYYLVQNYDINSDNSYELMRYPLHGLSPKPKSIYKGQLERGTIQDLYPYGKYVYFLEHGGTWRFMMYDIEQQTVRRIVSDDDSMAIILRGIIGNRLYYQYFAGDLEDRQAWKLFSSDLEGNDIQELPIQPEFLSEIYITDKHLFVVPVTAYLEEEPYKSKYGHVKREITVYDWNFRVVDRIAMTGWRRTTQLIPGDDHYLFAKQYDDEGQAQFLYLDKSRLGSGNATFQPLF